VIFASVAILLPARTSPRDLFAPYADISPGQSHDSVLQKGFKCQFNVALTVEEFCRLTLRTGLFSEIRVWFTRDTVLVGRAVFIPREKMLTVGDLAALWGKPEIAVYNRTANLRWRDMRVVTILQDYNDHFSYWYPITYVAFDAIG